MPFWWVVVLFSGSQPSGRDVSILIRKVRFPHSLDDVEALATTKTISFALDLDLLSIIIGGDSEMVIKASKVNINPLPLLVT